MIIDISSYQKIPDWSLVKAVPDLKGVYIKSSEGVNAPDKDFNRRAEGAIKAGIPVGFYHFATLNKPLVKQDAEDEAKYFLHLTNPYKATLPFALDIEVNAAKLKPEEVLQYIQTFLQVLKLAGRDFCLYSYTPFLNNNLPKNHGLGNVKLWLASYTPTYITPKGWVKPWLWQYTSTGRVNGISTNVDLNKLI